MKGGAVAVVLSTILALSAPAALAAPAAARLTLDASKGRLAVVAYRRFLDELCDGLWLGPSGEPMRPRDDARNLAVGRAAPRHAGDEAARAKLTKLGLAGADEVQLCDRTANPPTALASGAFSSEGADEVLIKVWTGRSAAEGEYALALMRNDGRGYRFVAHELKGNDFEAPARLAPRHGRDVLLLCHPSGRMGSYTTRCGFYGAGAWRDDALTLPTTTTCGRSVASRIIGVAEDGDRVSVTIEETRSDRTPGPGQATDAPLCDREANRSTTRATIDFHFEGRQFRRGRK